MNRRSFFGRLAAAVGLVGAAPALQIRAHLQAQTVPRLVVPMLACGYSRDGRLVWRTKWSAQEGLPGRWFYPVQRRVNDGPPWGIVYEIEEAVFELVEVGKSGFWARYRQISGPDLPTIEVVRPPQFDALLKEPYA